MMDRVARQVESWQWLDGAFRSITEEEVEEGAGGLLPLHQAVARCTAELSRHLRVRAVAVRTTNGRSAAVVSASRPAAPVVALTADEAVARRLALWWGVLPRTVSPEGFERPQAEARRLVAEMGLASAGQVMLLLAGFGKGEPSITVLSVG